MTAAPTSVRDLVRALGGPTSVAAVLGVTVQAVSNWNSAGIPQRHRLTVWQMAKAKGIAWQPPGTEGMTLAPAPPRRQAAA